MSLAKHALIRWMLAFAFMLGTPAVQQALLDAVSLVSGDACCGDEDEGSGPCAPDCGNCAACSHPNATAPTPVVVASMILIATESAAFVVPDATPGHHTTPFRPPAA